MDPNAIMEMIMGGGQTATMNKPLPNKMQMHHAQKPQQNGMDPNAIIAMLMGTDPNNANPNLPPMKSEDDEHGYWDAKNMGNGKGSSFMMEDGEYRAADPVGNGASPEQLLAMIMGAQTPGDGGPSTGAPRSDDPFFAAAEAAWINENDGNPPASDGEFAEIEAWAQQLIEESGGDLKKLEQLMSQR